MNAMKTIWKYQLVKGPNLIGMPTGAQLLHVTEQGNEMTMWALVTPDVVFEERLFFVYGTGDTIVAPKSKLAYIGTALLNNGSYVLHAFERL